MNDFTTKFPKSRMVDAPNKKLGNRNSFKITPGFRKMAPMTNLGFSSVSFVGIHLQLHKLEQLKNCSTSIC